MNDVKKMELIKWTETSPSSPEETHDLRKPRLYQSCSAEDVMM